ncbi:hypothetical protein GCM10028800_02060 [Nesterenkonia populi]
MTPRRTLARSVTAFAAAAALTLTACGPEDDAEFEESGNGEDAEQTSETEETDGGTDADDEDDAAGDEDAEEDGGTDAGADSGPVDPEDAVETVTYSIPNPDIDGEITVGFHHLRTREDTMELLLTITPEFGEHEAYSLYNLHDGRFSPPRLSDRENLKQYTVLGAQHGSPGWATDGTPSGADINDGASLTYWANYPLPEDDIDTISVSVHEAAPEFEDIEIDWQDAEPADHGGDGSDPEADGNGDDTEDEE